LARWADNNASVDKNADITKKIKMNKKNMTLK